MRGPRGPRKTLKAAQTLISYDTRKLSGSVRTPHIQKREFFFHIRMRVKGAPRGNLFLIILHVLSWPGISLAQWMNIIAGEAFFWILHIIIRHRWCDILMPISFLCRIRTPNKLPCLPWMFSINKPLVFTLKLCLLFIAHNFLCQ